MPPKAPKLKGMNPFYEIQPFVLPMSANAASQYANSCKEDLSSSARGLQLSFTQGPCAFS